MIEKIQTSGLCINCLNEDECSYRFNHTKPIIFCEEFTCTDPSESKNNIYTVIKRVDDPINPMPKGICSNCENLETCKLQKTDDNVIHCEEYR
ncbi:MAG: hypothetical protein KAI40_02475 [Desulfobacterales bacterium]|nr:hypothetical protein [Desulfobacterales bacterium]